MTEEKPVVGVLAIIKSGNKYLVVRRHSKAKYQGGRWGFVGEGIQYKEDPVSCLIRGVKEETNLDVRTWELFNVYSVYLEKPAPKHVILIAYICETENTNVKINEEADDFAWLTLNEIRGLKNTVGNGQVVRDLKMRGK